MSAPAPLCGWSPSVVTGGTHPALADPWEAAAQMGPGVVIALLTATEGPAYRDLGAAMAIGADDAAAGAITSGCIEADLILHAAEVRRTGRVRRLRYGAGSPYFDLKLPCGGGVEVTLFPVADPAPLRALSALRAARAPAALLIAPEGGVTLGDFGPTGWVADAFRVGFRPAVRHVVFGAGAEALVFAQMVARLGYDHLLLSHDPATLASAARIGVAARPLARLPQARAAGIDADTAVTLFYHDHDYEPEILRMALASPAFYVGAQGSRRAQQTRKTRLAELGVAPEALARLRGPIGLIASTRDAQSLAVSVLAEIVAEEQTRARAFAPAG